MKRARYVRAGRLRHGVVTADGLREGDGSVHPLVSVRLLPPVRPRWVVGIALNYRDHAAELSLDAPEAPALFVKPPRTVVGCGDPIVYPRGAGFVHYEGELAVVVGRAMRRVAAKDALAHVAGYTIANDVTARDFITNVFRPPLKAKGFDSFCPLGPWLVVDEVDDPGDLGIRTYVNDRLVQEGSTRDMILAVPDLLAYLSEFTTLAPGDVVLTGTPRGISPIRPGDRVRVEVDRLGALENPVIAEGGS